MSDWVKNSIENNQSQVSEVLAMLSPCQYRVFLLVPLPGLLNIAILATLDLMKSRGDLPFLEVFLGYVKRLSVSFIVLG
ncbi:MAG: hypothetical protein K9W43_12295 [Candidatus Thorarchaeota archaeon]|nr:hypothetical protein [Candidatus Thorarchaeota archaeon]